MMSAWWIFVFYLCERSFELWLAGRNRRRLLARGGRESGNASYRRIVLLHSAFFAALILEAWPWRIPFDRLTLSSLALLALLQLARYWCILTLGEYWNTRIIVVPGAPRVRRGPYRWLRHPNYLVVSLEIAALPLLLRAPVTLIVFSLANLIILRQRIALEEAALKDLS